MQNYKVSISEETLIRIGANAILTADADIIKRADKVIMPGVGEAQTAMKSLKSKGLDVVIKGLTQPFLGVCLGMQILCRHSEERNTECLGIFDQTVLSFPPDNKVPHMGWNAIKKFSGDLFKGIKEESDVYFVHSYYVESSPFSSAECNYMLPFCAAIQKDNFYATQFHVEKSADIGDQMLKNFLEL